MHWESDCLLLTLFFDMCSDHQYRSDWFLQPGQLSYHHGWWSSGTDDTYCHLRNECCWFAETLTRWYTLQTLGQLRLRKTYHLWIIWSDFLLLHLFTFNWSVKCSCTFLCVSVRNELYVKDSFSQVTYSIWGDKCIDFAIKMSSVDLQVPG